MIMICHFILDAVCLYDGILWMETAVYELMNMPEVQNFIYTVSRVNRLADSFVEALKHWDVNTIISFDMLILFPTIFIFVLERQIRNYPANYLKETNPGIFGDCIGLVIFLVFLLFMASDASNYAVKTLCVFFAIANVKAVYGIWRQLLIINDDKRYLI